jgi:predicted nucleotidyltransferase
MILRRGGWPPLFIPFFLLSPMFLFSSIMRLEHYSVELLKQQVLDIIYRHVDNPEDYKVFFFGSRVSDTGDERSDIDIGIEGEQQVPHSALAKIREEFENLSLLYKIDIVDFKRVTDEFKTLAEKTTERIQ